MRGNGRAVSMYAGRRFVHGVVLGLVALGCADQEYYGGENKLVSLAMTDTTPPIAMADDTALFLVEERIELAIAEPDQEDLDRLAMQRGDIADPFPYDRLPWVRRGHFEVQLDWALTNLDDMPHRVDVTVNGFNEFHEYLPGFVIEDDEIILDFSQWERSYVLEPNERRVGTVREEQLDEVAVDLATVVNGVTNANAIVHPNNHSSSDDRAAPFIPEVVPALTGVRVGVRSFEAANVVLELTVRTRDEHDRIVRSSRRWELPVPTLFEPSSVVVEE